MVWMPGMSQKNPINCGDAQLEIAHCKTHIVKGPWKHSLNEIGLH